MHNRTKSLFGLKKYNNFSICKRMVSKNALVNNSLEIGRDLADKGYHFQSELQDNKNAESMIFYRNILNSFSCLFQNF